jgi:hypothetical protein
VICCIYLSVCWLEKLKVNYLEYWYFAPKLSPDLHLVLPVVQLDLWHETGGLVSEVKVAEMAKYMQTKNVDIPDGRCNWNNHED